MDKKPKRTIPTASQVLHTGSGSLISVLLTATAAGVATISFYDGQSTQEEKMFTLSALANTSPSYDPTEPVPFLKGLYVSLGSNIDTVIILSKDDEQ